jgi:hypothetical protein
MKGKEIASLFDKLNQTMHLVFFFSNTTSRVFALRKRRPKIQRIQAAWSMELTSKQSPVATVLQQSIDPAPRNSRMCKWPSTWRETMDARGRRRN